MNNSTFDEASFIQKLNDEKASLMVPATVYIVILMVSGLIGNLMVCHYYIFQTRMTTNSFFIVILALYDLIVCSICMPTEIADIELFYTFENNIACKILRFLNYLASMGSILTLLAIAVDRYRRIYKHTGKQMTMKHAKVTSLVVFCAALLLAWPSLLIYGSIMVPIPNDLSLELRGSDCTSTKDEKYRPYVWAFNLVHFGLFIVLSIALCAMYGIIGKVIFSHRRNLARHARASKSNYTCHETSLSSENNKQINNTDTSTDRMKESTKPGLGGQGQKDNKRSGMVSESQKKTKSGSKSIDNESIRITIVMIVVTVLFISSFLPYLSLTVWRIKEGKHEAEFLSGAGLVAFKIGSRSFLLNSSLNPWIYGIFNSSFRNFYFQKLMCCRRA